MPGSPFNHFFVLFICLWLYLLVNLASTGRAYVQFHDLINVTGPVSGRMKREIRHTTYTDEEKQRMVDIHNKYRTKTNAADMVKMKWDNDLEKSALAWVKGCKFEHPDFKRTAGEFSPLGQNLHVTTPYVPKPEDSVTSWYNEIEDYTYSDNFQCTPGKMCGHYTQVIWSSTHSVGCAMKYCDALTSKVVANIFKTGYLVVCDYGPAGNYRNEFPYVQGAACSKCPEDRNNCDNQLCSFTKSNEVKVQDPKKNEENPKEEQEQEQQNEEQEEEEEINDENSGVRSHHSTSLATTANIWIFVLTTMFGVKIFKLT